MSEYFYVGLALTPGRGNYKTRPAPGVNEKGTYIGTADEHIIRVYHEIDSRYMEDIFAKLAINYSK